MSFALLFILASILILPLNADSKTVAVNDFSSEQIFSGSNGSFFVTQTQGANFQLYRTNRKPEQLVFKYDNSCVTNHLMLNNNSYIVTCSDDEDMIFSMIFAYNDESRRLFSFSLDTCRLKDNCLAVDKDNNVYFVAESDDKAIRIFDVNGAVQRPINLDQPIKALYQDHNYNIYIITENTVIPLDDMKNPISSVSPSTPFEVYNDICIDSGGNVYTFDENLGFSLNDSIKCDNLFIADGSFYQYNENCIYRLSAEGKRTAKYECSDKIADIASSGKNIGIITSSEVLYINTDRFKPISENSGNNNSSDDNNSKNNIPDKNNSSGSQNEKRDTSSDNSGLNIKNDFNCSYVLSKDGYIYDIPLGTTIATVKKNITGDGVTLTFRNKDGEIVKNGKLGSGYSIEISSGETSNTYCVVFIGELTGEGNINSRDTLKLTDYLLNENEDSEWFYKAADLNGDGEVNSIDLLLLQRMML